MIKTHVLEMEVQEPKNSSTNKFLAETRDVAQHGLWLQNLLRTTDRLTIRLSAQTEPNNYFLYDIVVFVYICFHLL